MQEIHVQRLRRFDQVTYTFTPTPMLQPHRDSINTYFLRKFKEYLLKLTRKLTRL